jgi:formylglycine-generating enzyme required for sulfatase activity
MFEAPTPTAASIYLTYVREDVSREVDRLREQLLGEFGRDEVFLDRDLKAGEAWSEVLESALQRCRVMVVLIGQRGLDPASRFMRHEIASALERGVPVIPVLLDQTTFPQAENLPADLQPLLRRRWLSIRWEDFERDVAQLVETLREILGKATEAADGRDPPVESTAAEMNDAVPLREESSHRPASRAAPQGVANSWAVIWHTALTTSLAHTRRRVAQVLHPLGGEVLPAITAWRAAFWLALAALLLWGVVWPYLWPALMPTPAAVAATDAPLPAATGPVLPVGTRFRDCRDATCPWLRVLPAGTFTMGSPEDEPGRDNDEGPQHQVTVTRPFAVMETEVTVGLFQAFVAETRYPVEPGCWIWEGVKDKEDPNTTWRKPFAAADQGDDHPVVCISWNTAQAFARWMTKRTGQPYRLLSEAEWEYAARAGSQAAYSFGADAKQLCRFANVGDIRTRQGYPEWGKDWVSAECDDGHVYTAAVGTFQPNAFGLYDMHGNAWEWVQDCQNDYKAEPRTAEAVESTNCANRLLRGGGWVSDPRVARSAVRYHVVPSNRNLNTGFRLARMLPTGS